MKKITLKISKKFSILSGDKNKIHFDKKIARQFFFKEPIVHGINLVINGLIKFFDHKNYFFNINQLNIIFSNFCLHNENLFINLKKNGLIIKSKFNEKLVIDFNYKIQKKNKENFRLDNLSKNIISFYNLKKKNYIYIKLFKELLNISKLIGNHSLSNNNMLHSIKLRETQTNYKIGFRNKSVTKNMFLSKLISSNYDSQIIFSKLAPLNLDHKNYLLKQKIKKNLKNKKILFFGINSDIALAASMFFRQSTCKIFQYSLKNFKKNSKKDKKKLITYLINLNPDYIFYFSSPLIKNDNLNKSQLYKIYYDVYYTKLKIILDMLYQNKFKTLVFYPSSIFLNKFSNKSNFYSYLKAKKISENLCKSHKYRKSIFYYRLPQFKTSSTYNLLGFYKGKNLNYIKIYLEDFLKKNIQ